MKKMLLSPFVLGSTVLLGLCSALYFEHIQKTGFKKTTERYDSLQRYLKSLENDLSFLDHYHKQLNFLIERGWLIPKSRLIGAEEINQWAGPLNGVRFTFEPETIKEMTGGHSFKVSKIIIEADSLLDKYIYDFSKNILKNYSGILILRKLSVNRNEKINETNLSALRQHKRPNFVFGEITYEWFAMEDKSHEE